MVNDKNKEQKPAATDVEKKPENQEKSTDPKDLKDKKNAKPVEEDLSDEDKQLKDELNLCVQRLQEPDTRLYKQALEILRVKIKESTSSMTSVPKPLKFLRDHYNTIKEVYTKINDKETKEFCADIISVLGMTISETRECLKYRFLSSKDDIGSWGHEYVRHLTAELSEEWKELDNATTTGNLITKEDLLKLAEDIVPFYMKHNAEAEACDLLMEIDKLDILLKYVEKETYQRVCLYLAGCVPYVPEPEDSILLKTTYNLYRKFEQFPLALRCAIQLNDTNLIHEVFFECKDESTRKQLAFMLGRQQIFWDIDDKQIENSDTLKEIMSNSRLSQNFLNLARELDIMEPKQPDDIYKSHLDNRPAYAGSVDSARQNLASSFVNGFVNTGFGQDKLLTDDKEAKTWIHKNKDHGIMSTTATLGLISLWDVEVGLTQIDKYLYSEEDYVKAGALLACGIVNCCVQNECDPALALLSDYVSHKNQVIRIGSILGLGLAYAGKNRADVISLISNVLGDPNASMEVIGVAALSLGLIAIGSADGDVTSTLMQTLLEKSEVELKDTFSKYLALSIGLIYLGRGESVSVIIESLKVLPEPLQSFATILVDVCAYAGTGNVLKIQELLDLCSEHLEADAKEKEAETASSAKETTKDGKKEKEKKEETPIHNLHQAVAVIGISLIAMNEEIGAEMALRSFGHLLHYGEPIIKRSVPLALALISVSNPKLSILDTLSKFSHDSDPEVSYNSIFALGIVGAGTNNARLASMLRQLALFHAKDQNNLFMVRLAQGLTHLGKGTMTLNPYHSHKGLLCQVALGGLLAVLIGFIDVKNIILGKSHYMLFNLALAIQPRMLVTFDENLQPLPVTVRVGQAVDVVGQAGKPKTITGFQTHTTPVLLAYGERAELATDEYICLTPILEGFVVLKKNPDFMEHS